MRPRWLAAALVAVTVTASETDDPAQPVKSPIDDREYRYVVLPNDLRALLIHDPGSGRAAASASLARGRDQDPVRQEGLAQLVEHLLFVGTHKYPEIDGFADFVQKHNGAYGAYTATDRTTYHVQIDANHLPEVLDRFAQFFVAPLFEPHHIEREKQAVEKENQQIWWQKVWPEIAVFRQQLNPNHPWSRLHTSNLETLSGIGGPEVRAFFEANYSADTITLAVLGPADLDVLQALTTRSISRARATRSRSVRPSP